MRSLTGREGSGSNRSPPQSLLVIEKDGSVFGRNWRRRTCGQKTAQDRDRDNQLAHRCHLLSREKQLLRLRPEGSRSSTTVARTSGAADRVGSGAAFAQGTWAARAAAMPVSILPSRTELFILANAASPASFRGSREYTRDGRRRRDVADDEGDAPGEPGPGAVVERRREPVGARSTSAGTQGPCGSWRQRSTDGPTASEPSGLRGAGAPRGAGAECGPAFGPGPSRRRAGSRPRRAAVR